MSERQEKPASEVERIKSFAQLLNNLLTAMIGGGLVAPSIAESYSIRPYGLRDALIGLAWLAAGAGLHLVVQTVLRRLD